MHNENTWIDAFNSRDDLLQYGDNAIGLFALSLKFDIDDIHSVAAESVTDGNDDKKCDIIYLDMDENVAVVAQCYFSSRDKQSAPSNKASDLNTAVSWLLQRPISELPLRLQSAAKALRSGISDETISRLEIMYIHNLPESKNVSDELRTVEQTASAALRANYNDLTVQISSLEIGQKKLEELYSETLSPILVSDEFSIKIASGFEISGDSWRAYVTSIPARFLHKQYKKYKT
ncbi:hypothetical protein, partial [Acidithiobacillus sp.]|uniref:hypothetical protein n=1 Tax=Acidithiobacillus sp. TaxID=1872118 RepID=UPI003D06739E